MQDATLQLTDARAGDEDLEQRDPDDYANACVIAAALRQCDRGLDFVESAVSRFSLPDEDRSFLTEQIGMIRSRRLDPNFYLAIVGEFSSGKSTLINALLGAELLPTGAIPTTSAVTRICHSPHISVEFHFRKDCDRPITLCSTAVPVAEIVAFLKTVMMDPERAADIVEIRVGHPSPFLANGIVIIDTPGFDAPEAGHAEIAKHVVGLIADCAVVLTPSYSPASLKLVDFLNSYLGPYLHRCVYVVTMMDRLRGKDGDAVLSHVRRRLGDSLTLQGIQVQPVAAQIMLDRLYSSDISASELVWAERFREFERALDIRVKRERASAIAERIARLQGEALGRVENHLKHAADRFDQRKERIAAGFIPDVPAFTLQQRLTLQSGMRSISDQALDSVSKEVSSHCKSSLANIRDSIFSASTTDAVTSAYNSGPGMLRVEAHATKDALAGILAEVQNRVLAAMRTFDAAFEHTYTRLEQAIGETLQIPELPSDGVEFKLAPPVPSMPELPKLPVLQRIWEWFFGADIDEWKDRSWKGWEPEVSRYFSRIEREARDACDSYLKTTGNSLDSRISHYVNTYSQIVASIREREDHEVLRMLMLSNLTQLYVVEAQRLANSLLRVKDDLAALA